MKVLQFHNAYFFPGGEDQVAASEAALLRNKGHIVLTWQASNHAMSYLKWTEKFAFYAKDIFFSLRVYQGVRALIERERPDVAHFHNAFFMIGPAAYAACFDAGVPVVQTLHNYRFLCAVGTFFREGRVCEECLSQGRGAGVRHGCWHGSVGATFLMTQVIRAYEKQGVLRRMARYIALSAFSRQKYIDAGWEASRIVVKANFLEKDPGFSLDQKGSYVLYAGALQKYKGAAVLLKAWGSRTWPMPLKMAGSGPLAQELQGRQYQGVEWLGQQSADDVLALIRQALCVVVPSECYENFPRIILEAYACGVPVVASRIGALEELVEDHVTGRLFKSGDAEDLRCVLEQMLENPSLCASMGQNARKKYDAAWAPQKAYEQLMQVYTDIVR